jgi:hypothetical protein
MNGIVLIDNRIKVGGNGSGVCRTGLTADGARIVVHVGHCDESRAAARLEVLTTWWIGFLDERKGIALIPNEFRVEVVAPFFLVEQSNFDVIVQVVHVYCLDVIPLECPELIQTAI